MQINRLKISGFNNRFYIITQLLWYIIIKFQIIILMTYSFSGRLVVVYLRLDIHLCRSALVLL